MRISLSPARDPSDLETTQRKSMALLTSAIVRAQKRKKVCLRDNLLGGSDFSIDKNRVS